MTVLMTTNYADGRADAIADKRASKEYKEREKPWHDALRPSLSVLLQEAASLSVGRSASGHEWLMLLNAGPLAVAPFAFASVRRLAAMPGAHAP